MPTTTDITDWTGVQVGDVVVYDGGLVLVDRISVQPERDDPEFLIAHVTGRALNDDGTPAYVTGMSPNARTITAARRGATAAPAIGRQARQLDAALRGLATIREHVLEMGERDWADVGRIVDDVITEVNEIADGEPTATPKAAR
jgi:hypothetical protein